MRAILSARSGGTPLRSPCSWSRFSPLWRMLLITIGQRVPAASAHRGSNVKRQASLVNLFSLPGGIRMAWIRRQRAQRSRASPATSSRCYATPPGPGIGRLHEAGPNCLTRLRGSVPRTLHGDASASRSSRSGPSATAHRNPPTRPAAVSCSPDLAPTEVRPCRSFPRWHCCCCPWHRSVRRHRTRTPSRRCPRPRSRKPAPAASSSAACPTRRFRWRRARRCWAWARACNRTRPTLRRGAPATRRCPARQSSRN